MNGGIKYGVATLRSRRGAATPAATQAAAPPGPSSPAQLGGGDAGRDARLAASAVIVAVFECGKSEGTAQPEKRCVG